MSSRCLLIDNSNTRTKFTLCGGGDSGLRVLPTAEISPQSVRSVLHGWDFDRVCLCSVVPWAAAVFAGVFAGEELVHVGVSTARGVDFSAYPGAGTLGADRVANVLAAARRGVLPVVAVDAGTATTFDVVVSGVRGPVFKGGVIAPGLSAMCTSLSAHTAQLPAACVDIKGPVVGRNTQEAMAAAVRVGYPAMVDAILSSIEEELGEPAQVLMTGGDAAFLATAVQHPVELVPALTLQGIALVADARL